MLKGWRVPAPWGLHLHARSANEDASTCIRERSEVFGLAWENEHQSGKKIAVRPLTPAVLQICPGSWPLSSGFSAWTTTASPSGETYQLVLSLDRVLLSLACLWPLEALIIMYETKREVRQHL